ncbi:hypothetical protein EPC71_07555 [Helicobacter pylori]|uniref:hypothetical protein n=1 Tax=Helicobacter pylori TaxID=210 RepID=UPI00123A0E7A|nr:hypothetical protein [Helicobacter pylori]KAA6504289.1 hypothetical protein EPC71_07555 [Helicobacter pylori]
MEHKEFNDPVFSETELKDIGKILTADYDIVKEFKEINRNLKKLDSLCAMCENCDISVTKTFNDQPIIDLFGKQEALTIYCNSYGSPINDPQELKFCTKFVEMENYKDRFFKGTYKFKRKN